MSSGSVFSETLQTITTTKLEELDKKRATFEAEYASLISTTKAESNPVKRLFILVDGVKACLDVKTAPRTNSRARRGQVILGSTSNPPLETDLKNLDRFLEQARYDPSVSSKVLKDWEDSLLQYLSVQSLKYQYADLYGKLVTEWLSSEKKTQSGDGDVEMTESFEEVPGAKKLESRKAWEESVFTPAVVDQPALEVFLYKLFAQNGSRKKEVSKAVKGLRDAVESFETTLSYPHQFNVSSLHWVIEGLSSSDLLTNEKRAVLKDFLSNQIILNEIADVLNMRMTALDKWSWGSHVPLEQRRMVNGNYNIYMHEDLLQAIFLQYIGAKWSVFFKGAFKNFRKNNDAWKPLSRPIPKDDQKRRDYFLGPQVKTPNLQTSRRSIYRKSYFMYELLDYVSQGMEAAEGEEEADTAAYFAPIQEDEMLMTEGVSDDRSKKRKSTTMAAQQPQRVQLQMQMAQQHASRQQYAPQATSQSFVTQSAPRRIRRVVPSSSYDEIESDEDETDNQPKRPMEAKQRLLHLLSSEIVINSRLHGELNCFRSVFEQWNPSLPHTTILTVLSFFGVSDKWQKFFKSFLEAPLKWMDDLSAEPRLRRRGTPGSHVLSSVFGEVILFCLDFSINQVTNGALLYRHQDDFWFWSPEYEKCAKAWGAVTKFTQAMGVNINEAKTGTVRIFDSIRDDTTIDDRLPKGEIRWGFLFLNPKSGRFEIDQKMVDDHIEELRNQLKGKSKSIIDWIQAWNTYAATFFSSNFGKAANCFGREHVDNMLAAHRHIQESLFSGGNVVQYLKSEIEARFGVNNVPDGFLFFPVELGGLDLKSPFINLLQIRECVKENPNELMDDFEVAERDEYRRAQEYFEKGFLNDHHRTNRWKPNENEDVFMSFEEYIRYREEYNYGLSYGLDNIYRELLERPVEQSIDISVKVEQALDQLRGNLRGITNNWHTMEAYWKWVVQMYGPEMMEQFGGLNVVDPGLLPIGMVSQFREKRLKWQG